MQLCTRVEAGEATPSQPNQLQRHHCLSFLAAGIVSGSTGLLVSSLSLFLLWGVTWPIDVTTPTHCADQRTLACVRAVRPNPPNPPSLRACRSANCGPRAAGAGRVCVAGAAPPFVRCITVHYTEYYSAHTYTNTMVTSNESCKMSLYKLPVSFYYFRVLRVTCTKRQP